MSELQLLIRSAEKAYCRRDDILAEYSAAHVLKAIADFDSSAQCH